MAALGGYRACASRSLPPAATSAPGRNSSSASFSTAVGSLESNAWHHSSPSDRQTSKTIRRREHNSSGLTHGTPPLRR